jgi:hypothetical protein
VRFLWHFGAYLPLCRDMLCRYLHGSMSNPSVRERYRIDRSLDPTFRRTQAFSGYTQYDVRVIGEGDSGSRIGLKMSVGGI